MLVLGRMDCILTEARDPPRSVGAQPLVDSTAEVAVASEHHETTDRNTKLSPLLSRTNIVFAVTSGHPRPKNCEVLRAATKTYA